ncbi:hypothetical protein Tco_0857378 [Tanacetum coccineum]|uniref:Retrotransposon gag domain-containing protein n=2 Tax=Tanacetum coccineum TaxID=301880 RepID=A0ABQ5BA30_9ASTR
MTTLADKAILLGADNRPPMLEKDMYDSWKSIIELYMMNRQHGRMILESVENAIQANCDIKATNIILKDLHLWLCIELSQPDLDLIVPVFQKGDDPIDVINHMMSFLTAVVSSCYPTTNNQLRNSLNLRQQEHVGSTLGNKGLLSVPTEWGGWPYVQTVHLKPKQETRILIRNARRQLSKFITSFAQQDALILSVIEQLKTQVVNCTNINMDNKSVNDTLTAELERYKEQVKVLKEGQNVDLRSNDTVSDSSAQSVEIDRLKQTLSEHLKEKESLMQTVTLLKNDFKKEESRNIDREIACFQNPFYLKKAQQLEPKLYDGNVIKNTSAIVIPDRNSVNSPEPTLSSRPTKVEVPKELPKVSMVNTSLKKLKHHLAGFDVYAKLIQELLTHISKTCPSVNNTDGKLVDVTPKNKDKRVRSLYIKPRTAHVQHSKLNAYSELKCVKCNGCMLFDNHDLCVLDFINNVNARKQSKSVKKSSKRKVWKPTGKVFTNIGYIWRPTGQTFTIVGNAYCPPSKTAKQLEEIHNFKQEGDETLYQAWERYNDLLYKCPTHDINNHQKVNIFYNGLGAMNRQLLDSQGPIPSMTPVQALTVIQTMADHFQKWHDGSSSRSIKGCSSEGIAAIDAKTAEEQKYLDKDCPLKEEVKSVEEAKYGEFG